MKWPRRQAARWAKCHKRRSKRIRTNRPIHPTRSSRLGVPKGVCPETKSSSWLRQRNWSGCHRKMRRLTPARLARCCQRLPQALLACGHCAGQVRLANLSQSVQSLRQTPERQNRTKRRADRGHSHRPQSKCRQTSKTEEKTVRLRQRVRCPRPAR